MRMSESGPAQIDIQRAAAAPQAPSDTRLIEAARRTVALADANGSVSLRLVGTAEMAGLNEQYRRKNGATNVLSFAQGVTDEHGRRLLGDVIVCADVVEREAREQGKPVQDHYLHLIVHGVLHLLGYDHVEPADAEAMEAQERALLATMNIADPYAERAATHPMENRTALDG